MHKFQDVRIDDEYTIEKLDLSDPNEFIVNI